MVYSQDYHRGIASLSRVHWMAIALAIVTGVVHLYVGWVRSRPSLALAGIGFFGGIAVFLTGHRRRLLYALGIGYVGLQIIVWAIVSAGEYTIIGYVDKTVQVVLLGVLAYLLRIDLE